ncbi:Nicotianamine aminotransferase A [Camellia lanceoleosa]|uniref:Nicotianamine aminotransferase A n=1 Tax=Camellia lanceoleosa TaxID=1840588 RepID=A0ACC0HKP3_9ERIC|nr:Nicotianamine aminotransferase A [Camellia lanceoleosa]
MASPIAVRTVQAKITANLNKPGTRPFIPFGQADPSAFFRTTLVAEGAIVDSLCFANFNGYAPAAGIEPRQNCLSVQKTAGAIHAIEVLIMVLGRLPGANMLLPRPGYPQYATSAAFTNLEIRHFNLLPEKGWEFDLDDVEALADDNTVAMSLRTGLGFDMYVGTSLIDMYVKCGELSDARMVFDELPVRDVSSWNALIAGYMKDGMII